MSKLIVRTALFSALFLLSLAVLHARSAAAPPTPIFLNLTGLWAGEFRSVTGLGGLASLNVTRQERSRFQGSFTLFFPPQPIYPPSPIRVLGTVSRSGEISLVGRSDVAFLEAHGQTDGAVMNLNYSLHLADGTMDQGMTSIAVPTGNGP